MNSSRMRPQATKADIDRYAAFKLRRQEQKRVNQQLLRCEFPLLFEKDTADLKRKNQPATIRIQNLSSTPKKAHGVNVNGPANLSTNENFNSSNVSGIPVSNSKQKKKTQTPRKAQLPPFNKIVVDSVGRIIAKESVQVGGGENKSHKAEELQQSSCNDLETPDRSVGVQITEQTCVELTSCSVSDDAIPTVPQGNADIKESVQDVLDYMLENNEVDDTMHQRLSNQRFSAQSLKRLSVCAAESDVRASLESPTGATATNNNNNNSNEFIDEGSDTGIELQDVDIFNALRAVISVQQSEQSLLSNSVEPEHKVRYSSTVTRSAATAADDDRSGVADSLTVDAEEDDEPKCSSNRVPFLASATDDTTVSLQQQQRDATDNNYKMPNSSTTQHSSNNSNNSSARNSLESSASGSSNGSWDTSASSTADAAALTSTLGSTTGTVNTTVTAATDVIKKVVTYPQAMLFDAVMKQGRLSAELSDRVDYGNHFKYLIQARILNVPSASIDGASDDWCGVRIVMLKRFSEFKSLRVALMAAVEANQRARDCSSSEIANEGRLSECDGRNSFESTFRASDTFEQLRDVDNEIDATAAVALRRSLAGRPSEIIPSLPSRQFMALGMDSMDSSYQATRQVFLNKWLQLVLSYQSSESDEYRIILRKFLTC